MQRVTLLHETVRLHWFYIQKYRGRGESKAVRTEWWFMIKEAVSILVRGHE